MCQTHLKKALCQVFLWACMMNPLIFIVGIRNDTVTQKPRWASSINASRRNAGRIFAHDGGSHIFDVKHASNSKIWILHDARALTVHSHPLEITSLVHFYAYGAIDNAFCVQPIEPACAFSHKSARCTHVLMLCCIEADAFPRTSAERCINLQGQICKN